MGKLNMRKEVESRTFGLCLVIGLVSLLGVLAFLKTFLLGMADFIWVPGANKDADPANPPLLEIMGDTQWLEEAASMHADLQKNGPKVGRVFLQVIDCLRFDFGFPNPELERSYYGHFPVVQNVLKRSKGYSTVRKVETEPPNKSEKCIKTLMSGSSVGYIGAFEVYLRETFASDSVLRQLKKSGKVVVHNGCIFWVSLFEKEIDRWHSRPKPMWEWYGEGDAYMTEMTKMEIAEGNWTFMDSHYGAIDKTTHKYGLIGEHMADALDLVNGMVEELLEAVEEKWPDTLMLITGDHGLTDGGTHGKYLLEAAKEESSTLLFAYHPSSPLTFTQWNYCYKDHPNAPVCKKLHEDGTLKILEILEDDVKDYDQITQEYLPELFVQLDHTGVAGFPLGERKNIMNNKNLAPTMSILLNTNIPYPNIGKVIPDYLPFPESYTVSEVYHYYTLCLVENIAQILVFLKNYSSQVGGSYSDYFPTALAEFQSIFKSLLPTIHSLSTTVSQENLLRSNPTPSLELSWHTTLKSYISASQSLTTLYSNLHSLLRVESGHYNFPILFLSFGVLILNAILVSALTFYTQATNNSPPKFWKWTSRHLNLCSHLLPVIFSILILTELTSTFNPSLKCIKTEYLTLTISSILLIIQLILVFPHIISGFIDNMKKWKSWVVIHKTILFIGGIAIYLPILLSTDILSTLIAFNQFMSNAFMLLTVIVSRKINKGLVIAAIVTVSFMNLGKEVYELKFLQWVHFGRITYYRMIPLEAWNVMDPVPAFVTMSALPLLGASFGSLWIWKNWMQRGRWLKWKNAFDGLLLAAWFLVWARVATWFVEHKPTEEMFSLVQKLTSMQYLIFLIFIVMVLFVPKEKLFYNSVIYGEQDIANRTIFGHFSIHFFILITAVAGLEKAPFPLLLVVCVGMAIGYLSGKMRSKWLPGYILTYNSGLVFFLFENIYHISHYPFSKNYIGAESVPFLQPLLFGLEFFGYQVMFIPGLLIAKYLLQKQEESAKSEPQKVQILELSSSTGSPSDNSSQIKIESVDDDLEEIIGMESTSLTGSANQIIKPAKKKEYKSMMMEGCEWVIMLCFFQGISLGIQSFHNILNRNYFIPLMTAGSKLFADSCQYVCLLLTTLLALVLLKKFSM